AWFSIGGWGGGSRCRRVLPPAPRRSHRAFIPCAGFSSSCPGPQLPTIRKRRWARGGPCGHLKPGFHTSGGGPRTGRGEDNGVAVMVPLLACLALLAALPGLLGGQGPAAAPQPAAADDLTEFRTVETALTTRVSKASPEPAAPPGYLGVHL